MIIIVIMFKDLHRQGQISSWPCIVFTTVDNLKSIKFLINNVISYFYNVKSVISIPLYLTII